MHARAQSYSLEPRPYRIVALVAVALVAPVSVVYLAAKLCLSDECFVGCERTDAELSSLLFDLGARPQAAAAAAAEPSSGDSAPTSGAPDRPPAARLSLVVDESHEVTADDGSSSAARLDTPAALEQAMRDPQALAAAADRLQVSRPPPLAGWLAGWLAGLSASFGCVCHLSLYGVMFAGVAIVCAH
jgi:hypothetical protein